MPDNYQAKKPRFKERRKHRLLTNKEFMFLCDEVCTYFQVSIDQLRDPGNATRPPHQLARQAVIYLAYNNYDVDYTEAGKRFGMPSNSAMKIVADTEEDRDKHPIFGEFLTKIENDIIARRVKANV